MANHATELLLLYLLYIRAECNAHQRTTMVAEVITDYPALLSNLTEKSVPLRILEYTVTPHNIGPEQLKLSGRYVFLAARENYLYFVGFEDVIYESNTIQIITNLIEKNSITSIYRIQRGNGQKHCS